MPTPFGRQATHKSLRASQSKSRGACFSVMQFVAPAQIFLVLWLLAATAPTATALMNGSLVAVIDARSKDLQLLPSTDGRSDEAEEGDGFTLIDATLSADAAGLIFIALADDGCSLSLHAGENTIFWITEEARVALSHSLLHTSVQRHRPRLA